MTLLEPIHGRAVATARRLCRSRADGDDLYQEAVLRAFEKLHTLREESRFRSWFYATLLNRHRTRQRRSFRWRLTPWEEAFPSGGPAGEDGEAWAERAQGAGRVARALASLSAEQREAVVLFELDGYSIEEIAQMQGASVPAVKSRLVRGREQLRRWYERNGWKDRAPIAAPARSTGARSPLERTGGSHETFPGWAAAPTAGEERCRD